MQRQERECVPATSQEGYEKGGGIIVTRPPPVLPGVLGHFLRVSCGRDDAGARPGTVGVNSISETIFEYIRDFFLFSYGVLRPIILTFVKKL